MQVFTGKASPLRTLFGTVLLAALGFGSCIAFGKPTFTAVSAAILLGAGFLALNALVGRSRFELSHDGVLGVYRAGKLHGRYVLRECTLSIRRETAAGSEGEMLCIRAPGAARPRAYPLSTLAPADALRFKTALEPYL